MGNSEHSELGARLVLTTRREMSKGTTYVPIRGKVLHSDWIGGKKWRREISFEQLRDFPPRGDATASGANRRGTVSSSYPRVGHGDGIMPGQYNVVVSVWQGQHEPVI